MFSPREGISSGVCRNCSELSDTDGRCNCSSAPEVNIETLMQQPPEGTFTAADAAHVAANYAKKRAANAPRDPESGIVGGTMKLGARVVGQSTRSEMTEQKGLGSSAKVSNKSSKKASRKSQIGK